MICFPPSPSGVSSSSHNLTLPCSCLPVPYFRRSHGFSFYYVLVTHRCTLHPWRFVTRSGSCLPPRLFLFDISISSCQAPNPWWCFLRSLYLLSFKKVPPDRWLWPKACAIFKIHLFYFMHLDDIQMLRTLYCQSISPFLARQTTYLMHVIRFYRCFTLKWLSWEILLLKSVDSAWF